MGEHFPVFQEIRGPGAGRFVAKHMEQWGWVSFLKEIAKTKVFDIPGSGMNSIDCTKASKAFDVLIFASEEKQFNEAQNLDFEAKK